VPIKFPLNTSHVYSHEWTHVLSAIASDRERTVADLITGDILLPHVRILAITYVFNSTLRTAYFRVQWKISQLITILKPAKRAEDVRSYRPISLLPNLSKLFEKLFIIPHTPHHPILTAYNKPPIWV
jgi:hypothetical protein